MALSTNLVAYYKLDESSGNATDSSGNGKTLTNTGTITYATGKINNGATNNGTGTKRLNGTMTGLTSSSNNTWSLWYKPSGHTGYIIDQNPDSGNCRLIIYNDGDGARLFANGNEVDGGAMTLGTWYFIVATKSNTSWELFVNGTSKGTTTTGGLSYPNDSTFSILNAKEAGGAPMNGTIDEVGVWDRVLNLTEIRQLYNNGTGQQYPFASAPIVFSEIISAVGSASGSTTISNTSTHAVGNNLIGLVFIEQGTIANGDPTGVTWGGNAMTKISTFTTGTGRQTLISLWGILSPLTGSRTITATFSVASNSNILWATYGGVSQSTAIGSLQQATNGTAGATTNTAFITTALTPSIANSWVVSMGIDLASGFTETAGTTKRYWANWSILDTGGPVSVSTTLGGTLGSSACWGNNAVVLPAIVTSTPTNASFLLSMI